MIAHVPLRGMVKSKVAEMMAGLYGLACKMPAMADDSGSTSPLMDKFVRMGLKFLKHRPGSKR